MRMAPGDEKLSNRFLVGVEGLASPPGGGEKAAFLALEFGGVVPVLEPDANAI